MLKNELEQRIYLLQERIEKHSLEAYIVTAEEDIWYLTGITYRPEERPFFIVVLPKRKPILVVPKLEEAHVHKGIIDCEILAYWEYPSPPGQNWYDILNGILARFSRVGIEANVKSDVFFDIQANELVRAGLVAQQRQVKSPLELKMIRSSARICDQTMATLFNSVYPGVSVVETFAISKSVQNSLIRAGDFDPITTTLLTVAWPAPLSAMPHSIPGLNDRLGQGPNLAMCYFRINGYASECERTFFLKPPSRDERELFQHMMNARDKALSKLRAGVRAAEIDAEAREYLIGKGLKERLLHRTGHGIGLGNHEPPYIAEGSQDILQENMVISIEPGIYVEGLGGFRHSDTVLITKDGYELLTAFPRNIEDVTIKKSNWGSRIKGSFIRKALKL
ncbi:MAG: M24 family metallopeptidase [Desulfitobacteriia bacterium]|jgi:Xaa-Pro dipeptidase